MPSLTLDSGFPADAVDALSRLGSTKAPAFLSTVEMSEREREFIQRSSLAFLAGLVADQSVRASIAWSLPERLRQRAGVSSLADPLCMDSVAVEALLKSPPALHRYPGPMSRYISTLAAGLADLADVPTCSLWRGLDARSVKDRLLAIDGIGPKKASLGVLLLVTDFGIRFEGLEAVPLAVDVHVRRVLSRLLAHDQSHDNPPDSRLYEIARVCSPDFPGALSTPLWRVGVEHCRPSQPACGDCLLHDGCRTFHASSHRQGD